VHIFIDESGSFKCDSQRQNKLAVVGGLVLPSSRLEELFSEFLALDFRRGKQEVKGSALNERQILEVVRLLLKYDGFICVSIIDMAMHEPQHVKVFKEGQSHGLVINLTDKHHPNLVSQLTDMAAKLSATSNDLFVQGMLLVDLLEKILAMAPQYWALRSQSEIEAFHWVLDGKNGETPTKFEEMWHDLIVPLLANAPKGVQSWPNVDYSGMKRFETKIKSKPPDFLPIPPDEQPTGIDMKMLLKESFAVADSEKNLGLQLADIAVNAVQRAINGKLSDAVFPVLGRLLLKDGPKTIRLLRLTSVPESSIPKLPAYSRALNLLGQHPPSPLNMASSSPYRNCAWVWASA